MSLPFCDPILDDGPFRLYIRLHFTLLSTASRACERPGLQSYRLRDQHSSI
jgi:hypothetical protein